MSYGIQMIRFSDFYHVDKAEFLSDSSVPFVFLDPGGFCKVVSDTSQQLIGNHTLTLILLLLIAMFTYNFTLHRFPLTYLVL